MHGFDWRAGRRRELGHVCPSSGHCWGPAVASGGMKSAQLCPSIAQCCVKVEARDSSLPGKLLTVNRLQNTFSLPLSDCSVTPFFPWPLELHLHWASAEKKNRERKHCFALQWWSAWQARLNFSVRVLQSEKSRVEKTQRLPSTASAVQTNSWLFC